MNFNYLQDLNKIQTSILKILDFQNNYRKNQKIDFDFINNFKEVFELIYKEEKENFLYEIWNGFSFSNDYKYNIYQSLLNNKEKIDKNLIEYFLKNYENYEINQNEELKKSFSSFFVLLDELLDILKIMKQNLKDNEINRINDFPRYETPF